MTEVGGSRAQVLTDFTRDPIGGLRASATFEECDAVEEDVLRVAVLVHVAALEGALQRVVVGSQIGARSQDVTLAMLNVALATDDCQMNTERRIGRVVFEAATLFGEAARIWRVHRSELSTRMLVDACFDTHLNVEIAFRQTIRKRRAADMLDHGFGNELPHALFDDCEQPLRLLAMSIHLIEKNALANERKTLINSSSLTHEHSRGELEGGALD